MKIEVMPSWLFSKYPITCTMCGSSFEHKGKRIIYPYPMKEYLCFTCFKEAMDTGLGRLNKSLRGEALTKEDFKQHSRSQFKENEDK